MEEVENSCTSAGGDGELRGTKQENRKQKLRETQNRITSQILDRLDASRFIEFALEMNKSQHQPGEGSNMVKGEESRTPRPGRTPRPSANELHQVTTGIMDAACGAVLLWVAIQYLGTPRPRESLGNRVVLAFIKVIRDLWEGGREA